MLFTRLPVATVFAVGPYVRATSDDWISDTISIRYWQNIAISIRYRYFV